MDLILGFRFSVVFFAGENSGNPLELRFQRVSGLSAEVTTTTVVEGGENRYTHKLPERVGYGNLLLERGMMLRCPLNTEFIAAMSMFKFAASDVMVTLLNGDAQSLAAWLFLKTYPVKWSTSDLNAGDEKVVIDTMELAYTRMQVIEV